MRPAVNDHCPICRGSGWVCENHPREAFDYELGCICGEGKPCECNHTDPPDTRNVTILVEALLK
jgi:hypothetical protein